jgi:hypothetical protein
VDHFLAGVGSEGVVLLGPVDGDGGNAISLGVEDVGVDRGLSVPCEFLVMKRNTVGNKGFIEKWAC